jgi:hypothetical protein
MKAGGLLCLVAAIILILPSCYEKEIMPEHEAGLPPHEKDIIVTPRGISAAYEPLGQVSASVERTSDAQKLCKELGEECKKMGGYLVINVKVGEAGEDPGEG